jgi:hypothetical protein
MTETAIGTPFLVVLCVIFGIGLAATMFKLDSLVSHPKKEDRQPLAGGLDEDGMPIFLEPDGKPLRTKGGKKLA